MLYQSFQTPMGSCGIAWNRAGLTRVLLPERSTDVIDERMRKLGYRPAPHVLPADAARTIEVLSVYFDGEAVSFDEFRLDWSGTPPFARRVYQTLRKLQRGSTTTYGDLARQVGNPSAARAIGVAMSKNPWPIIIPCHRVLASSGKIGGFSATDGAYTKRRLLQIERVELPSPVVRDLFDADPSNLP